MYIEKVVSCIFFSLTATQVIKINSHLKQLKTINTLKRNKKMMILLLMEWVCFHAPYFQCISKTDCTLCTLKFY
jgi:hypothetical protein